MPLESLQRSRKAIIVPWQISDSFGSTLPTGEARVCDTFAILRHPQRVLTALYEHASEHDLHNLMEWTDAGMLIRQYKRDSDSAKEANKFYRILGRREAV